MTDQCKSLNVRGRRCGFMAEVEGRCRLHDSIRRDLLGTPRPINQKEG